MSNFNPELRVVMDYGHNQPEFLVEVVEITDNGIRGYYCSTGKDTIEKSLFVGRFLWVQMVSLESVESIHPSDDELYTHFLKHGEKIVTYIRRAWRTLMPRGMNDPWAKGMVFFNQDPNEPYISLMNGSIEIHPTEIEAGPRYHPGFTVVRYKHNPGCYWDQPEVDVAELSYSMSPVDIAAQAVKHCWLTILDGQFERIDEEECYEDSM